MNKFDSIDNKKKKILKKLLILFSIILLIFAIINAIWYFGYRRNYDILSEKMEKIYLCEIEENEMIRYSKTIEDYSITIKKPQYLGTGGFISIGDTEGYVTQIDENGNKISPTGMYISLYIWPGYFGKYELGIDFYDEVNGIWEQVEVTKELKVLNTENLDDEYVKDLNNLISENKDEILTMISIVEKTFNIKI